MVKIAIVYIFYDSANKKVLIENRNDKQFLAGEKLFPGGKVEAGEEKDLVKALIREVKEELGVTITKFADLKESVRGLGGYDLYPYLVTSWYGDIPGLTLDKQAVLEWVSLDEFKPKLKPVQKLLNLAQHYVAQS